MWARNIWVYRACWLWRKRPATVRWAKSLCQEFIQGRVTPHFAGRAARGRDDPQGAVGDAGGCPLRHWTNNDPLAIRRDLGKVVAQAVVRRPANGFAFPPWPPERNSYRSYRTCGSAAAASARSGHRTLRVGLAGRASSKDEMLAVGSPDWVAVHVARVVSARQGLDLVPRSESSNRECARWIEDLQELVVQKIGDKHLFVQGGRAYCPSGETRDRKPIVLCPWGLSGKEFQLITCRFDDHLC